MKAWPLLASFAFLCSLWPLWQRQAALSAESTADAQQQLAAPLPPAPADPSARKRAEAPAETAAAVAPAAEPEPPTEPLPRRAAQPVAAVEGSARLSINAVPWAEVRVDGRMRGTTPVRDLALAGGSHVVVLSCPPLGAEKQLHVELSAGKRARIVVDLTQSPPSAFLDGHGQVR
jgi:hypothetical protein